MIAQRPQIAQRGAAEGRYASGGRYREAIGPMKPAWVVCFLLVACAREPEEGPPVETTAGVPATGTPATGTPTLTPPTLPAPTWEVGGVWSSSSSPRAADLDGDGVLDLVLGHGSESPEDPLVTFGGVTAHDGATGALLWEVTTRQEVFGSACFVELGGTPGPDLVLGGRHAELVALDGATGAELWTWPMDVATSRAAGWFGFYSARPLDDLDGDGVPELLLANGGDPLAGPLDPRPPGRLVVLSGATGAVVGDAATPDGAETYLSPIPIQGGFLFGTGGETWPGGLFRATVGDVLAGDLSTAEELVDGGTKGAIAPPAVTDLDGDGLDDVVLSTFGGSLVAVSGAGGELWRVDLPDHEAHGGPGLGQLDGDGVPDVFASFPEGTFPAYVGMTHLAVSGATGEVLWQQDLGVYASSGPALVDLDGDGLDEPIFGVNEGALGGELRWTPWRWDPVAREAAPLADAFERAGVSNPYVGDLDRDGDLELVVVTASMGDGATWQLRRYDLDAVAPERVAWGAYLGTDHDGRYR